MQNLLPGALKFPHCEQAISILLPHSLQNLAVSGSSVWHRGQIMFALHFDKGV
jgi:hypothetical protein